MKHGPKICLAALLPWLAPTPAAADGLYGADELHRWFGQPPVPPALDTALLYARKTTGDVCPDCTSEILSLIQEQGPTTAAIHLWPLYVQVDTAAAEGTATGTNARVYTRSSGWAAAHHGEAIAYGPGSTNIGFNAELSPMVPGARMVGLNLQAKDGYAGVLAGQWSDQGINLQSEDGVGFRTGIRFDRVRTETGIDFGPESAGQAAIRIRGQYDVGLDLGDSGVRLAAGARVCFEASDRICLRYDPRKARLLFLNGSAVLAYLNVAKAGNRCLNC